MSQPVKCCKLAGSGLEYCWEVSQIHLSLHSGESLSSLSLELTQSAGEEFQLRGLHRALVPLVLLTCVLLLEEIRVHWHTV